jgi:hypothetical protein
MNFNLENHYVDTNSGASLLKLTHKLPSQMCKSPIHHLIIIEHYSCLWDASYMPCPHIYLECDLLNFKSRLIDGIKGKDSCFT